MEGPHFVYDSIAEKGDTRVLCLHPGCADDELCGTLQPMWVDELQQPYEAISYCWGDASALTTMKCNESILTITQSSAAVLRRLRLLDQPRYVWIDRICINQDDLEDKQHQISKMKPVYEKASRVLIWLGHVDQADKAVELIRDICDHMPTSVNISGEEKPISRFKEDRHQEATRFYVASGLQRGTTGRGESHNEPFDPDRQQVSAFMNLLQQEWFKRVWCFQEAVASSDALVLTDSVQVPWVDVGFAGIYMEMYAVSLFTVEEARDGEVGLRNTKMVWFYWFNHIDGKQWKLIELLLTTDAFTSTFPEDKVFALCGLSSEKNAAPEDPVFKARYHDPKNPMGPVKPYSVYRDIVERYIKDERRLDMLSYVQHPRSGLRSNWPSWVCHWDLGIVMSPNPMVISVIDHLKGLNPWAGPAEHTFIDMPDTAVLRVKGWIIDTVEDYGPIFEDSMVEGPVAGDFKIADKIGWDAIHDVLRPASNFDFHDDYNVNLAMLLTAGRNSRQEQVPDDHRSNHADDMLSFRESSEANSVHDAEKLRTDSGDRRFAMGLGRYAHNRRVMRGEQGSACLGPALAERGDSICILFGARVPFLLRPRPNGDGYILLGECYVHGKMKPEKPLDEMVPGCREFDIC